jgi:hypothetical protein
VTLGINKLLLIDLILFFFYVTAGAVFVQLCKTPHRHPLVELLIVIEVLMEGALTVQFLCREFLTARLIV